MIAIVTLAVMPAAAVAAPRVSSSSGLLGDPVLDSAAAGALVGAVGGPVGMAIGAGLGILHGLWTKRRHEEQARAEEARQRAMDRELERQIAGQRPSGAVGAEPEGQGVLIVKDHLADAPSASPASREAGGLDSDGFRPVVEGGRLVRREHRDRDGRIDVVLHYDTRGRIVRQEESSRRDGRLDTSSTFVDGTLQRRASDTDGNGTPDLWAYYDGTGELARLESLDTGGGRRAEVYRHGRVVERIERNRRQYFEADGALTREEELDDAGALVAVAHYEAGRLVRRELYEIDESAFTRVPLVSAAPASR